MDKESGNSRGFGYVTFAESGDAEAAKNGLQGWVGDILKWKSIPLCVSFMHIIFCWKWRVFVYLSLCNCM